MSHTPHTHTRGVSMLLVMLITSIVLLTSLAVGAFALRAVRSAGQRSDAVRALYTAEDAVGCVKYWLRKDAKYLFSPGTLPSISCNNATIPNTDIVVTPESGGYATSSFTIWADSTNHGLGGVDVSVVRDVAGCTSCFIGRILVSGFSDNKDASSRTSERYQEYSYQTAGAADVMFVVDRSGSIEGSRSAPYDGDWLNLRDALINSLTVFKDNTPSPHVGIVTFGSGTSTVGLPDSDTSPEYCPSSLPGCIRIPETRLGAIGVPTDMVNGLVSGKAHTNLSLGLAVASAELMGKYYPAQQYGSYGPGTFEARVVNGPDLSGGLPSQPTVRDRPDLTEPDFIIIITDGEPNAFVRHLGTPTVTCTKYDDGVSGAVQQADNQAGGTLFFQTIAAPLGDTGCLTEYGVYDRCYDSGPLAQNLYPYLTGGQSPYQAICNAQMTVDAIKAEGITIAVISVGTLQNESWMRDRLASNPEYYVHSSSYAALQDAILGILEKLDLLKLR